MADQLKTAEAAHDQVTDFAQQASRPQTGTAAELLSFLLQNKKWWLTPIVAMLLLMGLLIALGSTAAAPFIYTLF